MARFSAACSDVLCAKISTVVPWNQGWQVYLLKYCTLVEDFHFLLPYTTAPPRITNMFYFSTKKIITALSNHVIRLGVHAWKWITTQGGSGELSSLMLSLQQWRAAVASEMHPADMLDASSVMYPGFIEFEHHTPSPRQPDQGWPAPGLHPGVISHSAPPSASTSHLNRLTVGCPSIGPPTPGTLHVSAVGLGPWVQWVPPWSPCWWSRRRWPCPDAV